MLIFLFEGYIESHEMGRKRDQLAAKKEKKKGGRESKRQQDPSKFRDNFNKNKSKFLF